MASSTVIATRESAVSSPETPQQRQQARDRVAEEEAAVERARTPARTGASRGVGRVATFVVSEVVDEARSGDDVPDGNRRLIDLGGMPLYQQDLDATHNGGILTTLLARAEHHSMPEHARTVQQTLIGDPAIGGVATRGETPSPGEAGANDARPTSCTRDQLNLL